MKCDDVERGCTWVGTVGTLEEHVATCKLTLLPCPKECKDDSDKVKQFMRKDLDKHLKEDCPNRDRSCEHCGEKVPYSSLDEHVIICPKKLLPCPNGCGSIMERQHVSEHVAIECELAVIPCKYMRLGCDRESKRKDIAAHEEDDKFHLRMAMDTTVKLENKRVELERCVTELRREKVLKFKFTDYQENKDNDAYVASPSHYMSRSGYKMALEVCVYGHLTGIGTHVSVYVLFQEGEYDAQLKWPFVGKITFALLNQLEDKNHHQKTTTVTAAHSARVGSLLGERLFIPHSALDYDAVDNTQYLKDNTLYFRMSVEPADQDEPWLQ